MRISYKALFSVRVRHLFYEDGRDTAECLLEPAPGCLALLESCGFVFKTLADGCAICAETALVSL